LTRLGCRIKVLRVVSDKSHRFVPINTAKLKKVLQKKGAEAMDRSQLILHHRVQAALFPLNANTSDQSIWILSISLLAPMNHNEAHVRENDVLFKLELLLNFSIVQSLVNKVLASDNLKGKERK
jgi:hypothetical protein